MVKIRDAHTLAGPLPEDGNSLLARVPAALRVAGAQRVGAALDALLAARAGDESSDARRDRVAAALDVLETLAGLGLDAEYYSIFFFFFSIN